MCIYTNTNTNGRHFASVTAIYGDFCQWSSSSPQFGWHVYCSVPPFQPAYEPQAIAGECIGEVPSNMTQWDLLAQQNVRYIESGAKTSTRAPTVSRHRRVTLRCQDRAKFTHGSVHMDNGVYWTLDRSVLILWWILARAPLTTSRSTANSPASGLERLSLRNFIQLF